VACTPDEAFAFVVDLSRWPLFRGFGPLPGIVEATCEGPMALGSRVRVRNTDGSVHTEVVAGFEPGHRYAVRMELVPPASQVMASIEEEVTFEPVAGGTRVRRRFVATPRAWFTTPLAWLFGGFLLQHAVLRHDAAVAAALGRPPVARPPVWAVAALVAALAALGWLLLQALHEGGHVLHAALSGASVERVELHPLRLSRTLLGANPSPAFVAWGGAVWGCLLPLVLLLVPGRAALAGALAGGCLLANGVYLGTGPLTHAGDAGDLLLLGAAPWTLVAFGVVACVSGLALWSGVGPGLAEQARSRVIVALALATAAIAGLELALVQG
jgi:hypothetical protein